MPLSEHEQRMLEQLERALYEEDPKFAATIRDTPSPTSPARKGAGLGVLIAAVGVLTMVVGLLTATPVVSVVGFIALLSGTYAAIRGVSADARPSVPKPNGFMKGAEERFNQRREGDA